MCSLRRNICVQEMFHTVCVVDVFKAATIPKKYYQVSKKTFIYPYDICIDRVDRRGEHQQVANSVVGACYGFKHTCLFFCF